jgi:hypothetical protein
MGIKTKAIDVRGTVDKKSQLHIDEPLPIAGPTRVRVIVLFPCENDMDVDEMEWRRAAAANPAFGFLKDEVEDIYKPTDGKPFQP